MKVFFSITSISNGTIFNEKILNITFSHKGCQMQLLLMLKKMSKTQMANFIPPFLTPIRSRLVKANNRPCPTVTQNNSLFFCPDFNTWTVRQKFVFPDNLEMVSMQPTADFEIWSKYKVVITGYFTVRMTVRGKGGGDGLQTVFWTKKHLLFGAHQKITKSWPWWGGAVGLCQPDRKISVFWRHF